MTSTWIFDTDQENFQIQVLERSKSVAILVDFWAPWCAPCRLLEPVLEEIVNTYKGNLLLGRVNADENPDLSAQYGIQGIPAVKLFINGTVADEFMGALPRPEVLRFLNKWVQTEADKLALQAFKLEEEHKWDDALRIYEKALEKDGTHAPSRIGRLRVLIQLSRLDEAQTVYQKLPTEIAGQDEVKALQTRMELLRLEEKGLSVESLQNKLDQHPEALEARYQLASAYAARKQYREALEELLTILHKDSHYNNDGARQMMIKLFELAGVRSPLAEEYRKKLARLIY